MYVFASIPFRLLYPSLLTNPSISTDFYPLTSPSPHFIALLFTNFIIINQILLINISNCSIHKRSSHVFLFISLQFRNLNEPMTDESIITSVIINIITKYVIMKRSTSEASFTQSSWQTKILISITNNKSIFILITVKTSL